MQKSAASKKRALNLSRLISALTDEILPVRLACKRIPTNASNGEANFRSGLAPFLFVNENDIGA